MTGQPTLFDPPAVHRTATDTEHYAAAAVGPHVRDLRARVLELAIARGAEGLTGWEAVAMLHLEAHETSVRPRLTDLARVGLLRKSRIRRPNAHGNRETVYVAAAHWRAELHAA